MAVQVINTTIKKIKGHKATKINFTKNMLLSFKKPIFTKQSTENA